MLKTLKKWFSFRATFSSAATWSIQIGGAIVLIILWQLLAMSGYVSPAVLPSPYQVVGSFQELYQNYNLLGQLRYSAFLNVLSYIEALLVSVPLGFAIGLFAMPRLFAQRYTTALRYLPLPAMTGLYMAWYGIGAVMKVQFLTTSITVYLLTAVIFRIDALNPIYEDTARTCGASRWQLIRTVYFPGVISSLWDDVVNLLPISWTYILVVEVINKSDGGIGVLADQSARFGHIEYVYAVLLVIMIFGFCQDIVIVELGKILMPHKREAEEVSVWEYIGRGFSYVLGNAYKNTPSADTQSVPATTAPGELQTSAETAVGGIRTTGQTTVPEVKNDGTV